MSNENLYETSNLEPNCYCACKRCSIVDQETASRWTEEPDVQEQQEWLRKYCQEYN